MPTRKSLVFCTAYTGLAARPWEAWDIRYRRWVQAVQATNLRFDQLLIVDDGSPTLPQWSGIARLFYLPPHQPPEPVVLFHFGENLGRPAVYDYPGWFRSFCFASTYAQAYGFDKIIHIESDAFLISRRIQSFVNEVDDDWLTFMGPRHEYPEAGLQVMAGRGLRRYCEVASRQYSDFKGRPIEELLPFTRVERRFIGDRYGEYLSYVPAEADWTMQTYVPGATSDCYHWWMTQRPTARRDSLYAKVVGDELKHSGIGYIDFIGHLARVLYPRTYLEIGADIDQSLPVVKCDCLCIDPDLRPSKDLMEGRRRAHLFRMRPSDFFEHYDLRSYLPSGVDLAFLDGLHHFESLLTDFINVERHCHERSVILIHDCLPTNARMAERSFRLDETEDASTRGAWTGDVWRLLIILNKYRPDLRIQQFDCGPTGLVACTFLDPSSRTLADRFQSIVDEFARLELEEFGLEQLWRTFPTLDSHKLADNPHDLPGILFGT